jgi:hypothetical protein
MYILWCTFSFVDMRKKIYDMFMGQLSRMFLFFSLANLCCIVILFVSTSATFGTCTVVWGASKIKLKKLNKKKTVKVRRVIIFLKFSRHPLLIWLHCFLHQYKTLKAVATATKAIVMLTPAKNLNKVFWRVSSGLPLV